MEGAPFHPTQQIDMIRRDGGAPKTTMSSQRTKKSERALSVEETKTVEAARKKCFILYEGKETPHRSCGIALAETFNVGTLPYQSLRKGGLSGRGECGAVMAGRLILGEILGDPNPSGAVTRELREAMEFYEGDWPDRIDRGEAEGNDIICKNLTGQFEDFKSPARASFCTRLAAQVAASCAEALIRHEHKPVIKEIEKPSHRGPRRLSGDES